MIAGVERSIPRDISTSVSPTAAMARKAASGMWPETSRATGCAARRQRRTRSTPALQARWQRSAFACAGPTGPRCPATQRAASPRSGHARHGSRPGRTRAHTHHQARERLPTGIQEHRKQRQRAAGDDAGTGVEAEQSDDIDDVVKNSAPNSAPKNEPRPPVSAAPPSTAAAMLVSV